MDKKVLKKLKHFIRDGRSAKLKSYIEKHEINIHDCQYHNGRSLLHYCCKYHNFNGVSFLLEKGIEVSIKDDHGNTALHIAMMEAMKTHSGSEVNEIYRLIILPIIERHPESLRWRNHDDITCRDLLDQLREKRDGTQSPSGKQENWESKLAEEIDYEHYQEWGRFPGGFPEEDDFAESYEDWSERMHREYHRKRKQSSSLPKSRKKTKVEEKDDFDSKLKAEREKMKKKYEENQKNAQQNYKRHKKGVYERKWGELSTKALERPLCFSDIPWPFKNSVSEMEDFLFHDITSTDARKKFLRDQIKRWHPDKFVQKFGNHVVLEEKEQVFLKVKQVSQELNNLLEKYK